MANEWLSPSDNARVTKYSLYRDIFEGTHTAAFSKFSAEMAVKKKILIYIVCNFGGLISKVSADLLFGEPITLKYPEGMDKKATEFLEKFIEENDLHTQNYEASLTSSYLGDIVLKMRRDADENVIAEYLSPELVTKEYEADNARKPLKIKLSWLKSDGKNEYLRQEIHSKGTIENKLYLIGKSGKIEQEVPLSTLPMYASVEPSVQTGVDDFCVRVIPNWRTSERDYGYSDYVDLLSLFDEANNRMSRLANILDKHSDPKLAVPPGVIREDGTVKGANFDLVEVRGNTGAGGLQKPEYIVWDASLDSAFKEIDKIVEFLFLFSETAPAAFGLDKDGVAASGRALKFKLIRTMAKISRKKNYYDAALKWAFKVALQLGGIKIDKLPAIQWQDGIPQDTIEASQVEEARMRAGNTSLESSIRRLDGGSDDDIAEEIKRIQDEKAESIKQATANIGGGNLDLGFGEDKNGKPSDGKPNDKMPMDKNGKTPDKKMMK